MIPVLKSLKEQIEKISGCRIYRNTLPHGIDFCLDLNKRFGRENFKVVFDVGANIGQSAALYAREFSKAQIHSFEPIAATYQKLVEATRSFPRVHPHQLGMGRNAGKVTINVNPLSTTSSIKLSRPEDHPETIEVETIAGFAEKHGIKTIDFLKVDTEGYDLEVLAGATPMLQQQNIHFVLCECEPVVRTQNFASFQAVTEFMGVFGYRLFGVYEQQPEWDGQHCLLYWNALFIADKLVPVNSKL